jgi:pimeloyl-ACP methyl ester carboxylesterase
MHLAYRDTGSGPPLILLHGMFGDHLDWAPVIGPLSLTHRVIALDLPGFGDSAKPDRAYDCGLFVAALDQLFEECAPGAATLVGNSFGGQIAMLYALERPERVKGLVLTGPGGFYRYSEADRAATIARMPGNWLRWVNGSVFRSLFEPLFVSDTPDTEAYLAKQEAKPGRPDWPRMVDAAIRTIQLHTELCFLDVLGRFGCPVLMLWGENDRIVPVKQGRAAVAGFANARLIEIRGCGHLPQIEAPARVIDAIRNTD